MRRRRALTIVGAAGITAVSGCLGRSSGSDGPGEYREQPAYASSIPADGLTDRPGVRVIHLDFERVPDIDRVANDIGYDPRESRVLAPINGGFATLWAAGSILGSYEFGDSRTNDIDDSIVSGITLLSENRRGTTDDPIVSVIVIGGDFGPDGVSWDASEFETVDERGEFEIFERVDGTDESPEGELVYASSDTTLVAADPVDGGGRPAVDAVVDAATGETDSLPEADADVDWLLGTAGHADVVQFVWNGGEGEPAIDLEDDDPYQQWGGVNGVASGTTVESERLQYWESTQFRDDAPTSDEFEAAFREGAGEGELELSDLEVDGLRVHATISDVDKDRFRGG